MILALTPVLQLTPATAAADGTVCGTDNIDYPSAEAAEAAGVDVSYDFACTNPQSEAGLYEATNDVNFAGMLKEVGSTDIPTTLVISANSDGTDYTVEVNEDTVLGQRRDQRTKLSDWIPGDQIRVIGKKNENTENIEATILVNLSIKVTRNRGINGWITKIDKENKEITYQWANVEHTFSYNDDTRFVAGLKNPATVDDLKINDRIRGRLLKRTDGSSVAKIVVVLRRGPALFMKIRTFRPNATLVRLDSTVVPTTIQVRIDRTPGLKSGDVNNLIGTEGTLVTVNVTENTKLVRKYFGRTTLSEFSVNDKLFIVGRVNDDGTVDAKVIKNNSIWKTSTRGYLGVVTEVNAADNYIMVNWTPLKYKTRKQLKEVLHSGEEDDSLTAAMVTPILYAAGEEKTAKSKTNLLQRIRARIKKITAKKIGRFTRRVKNKKIKINRIKHNGLRLQALIKRLPSKKIRVDIKEDTVIVVGTNNNATINDINVGDKVRIRGIKHASLPLVSAETIVVVSSLPEVEEPLTTNLDDINEIVSVIVTDDEDGALTTDVVTDTEEELNEDGEVVSEESESATIGAPEEETGDNNNGEVDDILDDVNGAPEAAS